MSITNISSLSLQSALTSSLQSEQATLTQLSQELATQQQFPDLTDYSPSDARDLINLQSSATQKQAYLNVISGVNNKLSIYNTTLTDLGSIVSQAQSLADDNPNYSPTGAPDLAIEATNLLNSVTVDLNQQINGTYIYSGSRYTTAPVQDLATLSTSSLTPTIYSNNQTLPSYDTDALDVSASGQTITISGNIVLPTTASATVNGTTYTYTVLSGDTTSTIAAGLAALIPSATYTSGNSFTIAGGNTINSVSSSTTDPSAYVTDQASVDTGYTINYGITSNDPAMQQMIAGLRYLQAAGNSTDSTTYNANIAQAATLINSALTSIQGLNTSVADNMNIMKTEQAAQNNAIASLTNQVDDISQVDVTQVSTEITSLEAVLQASYSATGTILKLSIVNYL